MTIRSAREHFGQAGVARGARDVRHRQRYAEYRFGDLGDFARHQIGAAARAESGDDFDGAGGKLFLRQRRAAEHGGAT
jgi:hypothetical protein